ncbi:hypothetical protein [Nisaea sp.]|uniref:hypothetical protein n=1 Tax=Nisaea sp. TaxID=2024842 RepID=UPI002B26CE73|nr:hypothetical protein [Nisaea sp.]
MRRLVFFARHNNDLDHFAPLVWKWTSQPDKDAWIVLMSDQLKLEDFRLSMLARTGRVKIVTQAMTVSAAAEFHGRANETTCSPQELVAFLINDAEAAGLIFDHSRSQDTLDIVSAAQLMGVKTVGVPHGDDPFLNYMITINDIRLSEARVSADPGPFDLYISPTRIHERRKTEKWQNRYAVLGLPRFCMEWLQVLDSELKPLHIPEREGTLKLMFFIRNAKYAVFWEEFSRLLAMLLQFPDVTVLVAKHPRTFQRRGGAGPIDVSLPNPSEISQIHNSSRLIYQEADEFHASQLIGWADAVLSLGTSVVYEAVQRGKPVFEIEYLHPNKTVIGAIFPNAKIETRDDMFKWMRRLKKNSSQENFYAPNELKKFRELCIEVGEQDVLANYISRIDEFIE